ncbi:DUF2059 domain-containing protein [Erythrobacter dokdonensis]|uniref:DUF2059 domain-containing protein n=1 Tax=Erythrobacter dokdonensis DSW-74 TaxID=1300349 RepID=A0A1A7BDG2_9SPHN|nr:DUF2059 domain-containing protein [Erythrobacter dokdonensis]OBV10573.1 hypothetical protein I603_1786 [Erythrobacter dokdonensis DSW-74]
MIRRRIFAATAGIAALALVPPPLAAQDAAPEAERDEADEMQQAMAMLSGMFPAETLTAEQEARLPQARRIIAALIPEGTLAEMMGGMFDRMMGPIMDAAGPSSIGTVTAATGLSTYELDLSPEQSDELARLFDPAWAERQKREMALMPTLMAEMMNLMEPGMRKAMSELYAINFNQTELDGIEAFFQTEVGATYARKSFTMASDPRILSASMEAMPQIMGSLATMEQKMAEASADLPAKRAFAELADSEKARVAELTGLGIADIEARLAGESPE